MSDALVRSECATCGEVELETEVIRLRVCADPRQSYYAFPCPSCLDDVYKPADMHVVALLTSGGVPAVRWEVPDELLAGPYPGSPISLDDLIDLHAAIEAHDAGAAASDRAQPAAPVTSELSAIERLTAAFRRVTP